MALKELSRVFPCLKTLSKDQVQYRILQPLKTFTITRNLGIYNLQATKERHESVPSLLYCNAYDVNQPRFHCKFYSDKQNDNSSRSKLEPASSSPGPESPKKKISLFQKMKSLYKDYWYIIVPVHLTTSAFWFGSFYYMAKSGVDVVPFMRSVGFSEKIIGTLENSNPAYANIALAYTLYKIASPVRYTLTIGLTTYSINKLKELGYIKPIPPPEKLVEMYTEKKEQLIEKKDMIKEKIQDNKALIQERYHNNKAYIQEKYSPEKCKIQLKARRDRLINSWDRNECRQNRKVNSEPAKANGDVSRTANTTDGTDVKRKGNDRLNER